jgi:hypothetical protein
MKYKYYLVIQDSQGNVVSGAHVSVYLAGTTTPAIVYGSNTASTGINTAPQVTSSANGAVAFWLDSNDYTSEQLFDISIASGSLNASLSNVQIIVWDAVNATKLSTARNISTSGDATGKVSFDGSADITIPLTLANTGVTNGVYGGLMQIPQLTVDAKGRVTGATAIPIRVDLTNATTDYSLQVGEEAVYNWDTTASLNKALHIATSGGIYLLIVDAPYQTASDIVGALNPNNTTYSNVFTRTYISFVDGGSSPLGATVTDSAFTLEYATSGGIVVMYLSTFTNRKFSYALERDTRTNSGDTRLFSVRWNDTSTAWTSLGTLTTTAANGTINVVVRRIL